MSHHDNSKSDDNFHADDESISSEYDYSPSPETVDNIINPFKNDRMIDDIGTAAEENRQEVFEEIYRSRINMSTYMR